MKILIKRGMIISLVAFAFLGLAKWLGVAYFATPVPVAETQSLNQALQASANEKTLQSAHTLSVEAQSDIKVKLNVKDNGVYEAYQNKLEWLTKASSLRGTQVGGAYPVDEQGNLIADISIRHRFDYFLTLLGELSYEQLIKLIEEDIKQSLQDPAQSQALAVFQHYQAYKYALKALDDEFGENRVNLKDRQAIINRQISLYQAIDLLRYDYFDQAYRLAFFAQEIDAEQALIADLQGANNNRDEGPASLSDVMDNLAQQSHATGQDLFSLESNAFGVEAAQRLEEVRSSRQILKDKVLDYLDKRDEIRRSALTIESQNEEIEYLKNLSFTINEKKRLVALEQIYRAQ